MPVTWLHDEMLAPEWVTPDETAVFVFDNDWITEERLSLKRIVFLYESAMELPGVTIQRGDAVETVAAFAAQHGADTVRTARSVDPRLKRQVAGLEQRGLTVELVEREPFVELPDGVDLKRFSRYWRKAEKLVMRAGK